MLGFLISLISPLSRILRTVDAKIKNETDRQRIKAELVAKAAEQQTARNGRPQAVQESKGGDSGRAESMAESKMDKDKAKIKSKNRKKGNGKGKSRSRDGCKDESGFRQASENRPALKPSRKEEETRR